MFTWQTSLKALSGAVSYLDIDHHDSLLTSVSWFYLDLFFLFVKFGQRCYCPFDDLVFFRFLEWTCGTMNLMWWMHWKVLLYLWYVSLQYHVIQLVNFLMTLWLILIFIIFQAASNGKYVDSCLGMLVSNFTPPYHILDKLTLPYGMERKQQVLSRVHAALKSIADLVPLAPLRLLPIVVQRMPMVHNKQERVSLIWHFCSIICMIY